MKHETCETASGAEVWGVLAELSEPLKPRIAKEESIG